MQVSLQPYEILVRFLPTGALSGVHVITNTVVTNDDGSYTVVPGSPQPLDTAGPEFTALIGTALSASQANATALQARVSELEAQVADLAAQIPVVIPAE